MKVGASKLVICTMIALLAVAMSTPASAQTPSFTDFSSTTGLTLVPSAAQSGNVLRLTPASGSQAGAAWFTTQQPVQNGFTTTFKFQFSNPSVPPADGIAFVIQNSSVTALGGAGGSIGYSGIPKSLAIEFDSFYNDASSGVGDPNPATHGGITSHVAVQSCGMSPNTVSHLANGCGSTSANIGGVVSLSSDFGIAVHTVTITFTPPSCSDCIAGTLQVNLDGSDLFAGGVSVDLTSLGLNSGAAWVGFTAATGGAWEEQDILSWSFDPIQAPVSQGQTTTLSYQNNAYNYQAQLNSGNTVTAQVVPIVITETDCNALILRSYPSALRIPKCFVYQNAGGPGVDSSVLFELTCPGSPSNPRCDQFDAELGTNFMLANPSMAMPGINAVNANDPFPGWLKGGETSTDPNHPCAIPTASNPLFTSNQVDFFQLVITGDPFTKGGSGGTGSCWVATYNQPDENPPGITITSPTATTYTQNQAVTANYSCSDPTTSHLPESNPSSNPAGPYLTLVPSSCIGPVPSGSGMVDTTTVGPHDFTVKAVDSGENQASQTVHYIVAPPAADVGIAEIGALAVRAGGKITYTVGVGDLSPVNNALSVVMTDTLPTGTTFVSVSGNREVCAIVNRRLSCTVTPLSCSHTTTSASCTVGTITPLSLSSLNGATMQVTVQLTNAASVAAGKIVTNVVSVTSASDPNSGNNSATWKTLVTR